MKSRKLFLPALFATLSCCSNTINASEKANNQGYSTGTLLTVGLGSAIVGGGIGAGVVDRIFRPDYKDALETIETQKTKIHGLESDNASLKDNLEQKEEKLKAETKWRDEKIAEKSAENLKLREENNKLQKNIKSLSDDGKISDEAQKELLAENNNYKDAMNRVAGFVQQGEHDDQTKIRFQMMKQYLKVILETAIKAYNNDPINNSGKLYQTAGCVSECCKMVAAFKGWQNYRKTNKVEELKKVPKFMKSAHKCFCDCDVSQVEKLNDSFSKLIDSVFDDIDEI